jgi:hypothetical protein
MNYTTPLHLIFFLLSAGILVAERSTSFPLQALKETPASEVETFFPVKNGEAKINGVLIREFGIKEQRVTVAYKNTTEKTIVPKYTIKIYNQYGILLGSDEIRSGILSGNPRLEPGDFGGDKLNIEWIDLQSVFQHSLLSNLPADFSQPAWISLSETNFLKPPSED